MEDARKLAWSQTADKLMQFYGFGAENQVARHVPTRKSTRLYPRLA
jgi:hypothetical protein